ncbi:MAG: HAD family hydrolase [Ignavibacteria bacterium]|nr:HAD family hydrolase [Ignavibacteria bacterium]
MTAGRLKKIKMIVCDIDGTLLNNSGQIDIVNKRAIEKLKQKNIIFTLASGRIHSSVLKFANEMSLDAPLISLDGLVIKNAEGRVFYQNLISQKAVKKIINICNKLGAIPAITTSEGSYIKQDKKSSIEIKKTGAGWVYVDDLSVYYKNVLEVNVISERKEIITYLKNKFSFPFSFNYSPRIYKSENSFNYYLEIRKKKSDKARALLKLCKILNINPCECAVICDWYNDIPLFKTKALKVALANSIDELKNNADIVTSKSNEENGVAEFIEKIFCE